jgi:Prokaryotic E2 family E
VSERIEQELALLRTVYPGLEWRPDTFWARIPAYPVPSGMWESSVAEVAFRIPPTVGEQPYAFFVRPGLTAVDGRPITNYTYPASNCFGDGWGQFSWAPEVWAPHVEITRGSNMLNFVRSFADRLREGP